MPFRPRPTARALHSWCVGFLLAASLGCGPSSGSSCIALRWETEIPGDGLCDVEVAPDGTIVALVGTSRPAFVELGPDGEHRAVLDVPIPEGMDRYAGCADLAIDEGGTRWATMGFSVDDGPTSESTVFVVRAPVDGDLETLPIPPAPAPATTWAPLMLASTPTGMHIGGFIAPDTPNAMETDPKQWRAFMATLGDDARLDVWSEHAGLASVRALVSAAPDRLYALAKPPSIDYGDAHLLALDPRTGTLAWEQVVGQLGGAGQRDEVEALVPIGPRGVLVARRDVIERYDDGPEPTWRYEIAAAQSPSAVAATDRVLALVPHVETDDVSSRVSQVLTLDGRELCSGTLELPVASFRRPKAVPVPGEDMIVIAADIDADEGASSIWLGALDVAPGASRGPRLRDESCCFGPRPS